MMHEHFKSPILQAKNISKSFFYPAQVTVLNGVSLDLFRGQSIAIMGASGQGKSTLLHLLGTLEAPCSGELFIDQIKVTKGQAAHVRNLQIGFVFQTFNLLEDYTAFQNVLMPAFIAGHPISKGSDAYLRALELLDHVGLTHRAYFSTKLLSGGEKQRVAIARALCNDPPILLADEPSGNLDQNTSDHIHQLLLNCSKNLNKGLIVVTHNSSFAKLCDRVLYLNNGQLTPA